jgi:hypothetical protein
MLSSPARLPPPVAVLRAEEASFNAHRASVHLNGQLGHYALNFMSNGVRRHTHLEYYRLSTHNRRDRHPGLAQC